MTCVVELSELRVIDRKRIVVNELIEPYLQIPKNDTLFNLLTLTKLWAIPAFERVYASTCMYVRLLPRLGML